MKTGLQFLTLFLFTVNGAIGQSDCTPIPEVNFPGGRVVMSFDGNVHDDDDIVAMAYSAGLWWAAGLQDKVVQFEYSNHTCDTDVNESDGSGAGSGDDSQNMRETAAGAISQFGYKADLFYDYERQGSASTAKMAAEIEKSTASNPLWIIAAGPMETVWRGLNQADKGFDHVTIISHSKWNERHTHCSGAHDWDDLKNGYQNKGVFFVENCDGGGCGSSNKLNDQNGGFSSSVSNWYWMRDSDKAYNRWIFGRNPFGSGKFDPSDAGMSYFLITGGPLNGGDKTPDHNDARKLMENPCQNNNAPAENKAPSLSFKTPSNGASFKVGDAISVEANAGDSDGAITKVSLYLNDNLIRTDSQVPYQWDDRDKGLKNLTKGDYRLKLEATDDDGATTTKTRTFSITEKDITVPGNGLPIVSFASPQDNQNVTVGDNVSIDVSATDDGKIVKYQIFVNGSLVDTDGSFFTPHVIKKITGGTYTIRVEVTDDDGGKTTKTINIKAENDQPDEGEEEEEEEVENPGNGNATFSFVTPANGADYNTGETISIDLAPTNGSNVVKYQIFVNDKLVDTDGANFTPYRITNPRKGTYTIRAELTVGSGTKTVKTVVVSVGEEDSGEEEAPTEEPSQESPPENADPISLSVSPEDGSYFVEGAKVSVNVTAASTGSSIVKYKIYVNGKLVDTDPAFFTPYAITNVKRGTYTVKVEVTDKKGRQKVKTLQFKVGNQAVGLVARVNPAPSPVFNAEDLSLRIAPNPVEGSVMNVLQKRSGDLNIINVYGILVKRINDAGETAKIDVSGLAPGIYILESDTERAKFSIPD